jgi:predicted MFS family arabinose efflux permease
MSVAHWPKSPATRRTRLAGQESPVSITATAPGKPQGPSGETHVSFQSRAGLNAANFFLAEITGVVMPFLGDYLKERQWSESALGIAIALAGLGVFLMQTPAGLITDRVQARRGLLAGASLVLGISYGLLPLVPAHPSVVDPLLFLAGVAQAFFLPLLGALALGLVGHAALNRTMGQNQGWNHAGNLAAAILAIGLVSLFGLSSVFYAVTAVSVLAAGSAFFIRGEEVDEIRASGVDKDGKSVALRELLKDRRVLVLLGATALFHLANAPVMPFLGAYIKKLNGSHVQVAAVVLVAQAVMIPIALAAGWLCDRWGRKWYRLRRPARANFPLLSDARSVDARRPADSRRHRRRHLRRRDRGDLRRSDKG